MHLLLATRNAHKTAEIATMLGNAVTVTDLTTHPDAPEVEETGTTFEANATLKANAISAHVGGWALADDSGIEVDALDREPGVYSARYAGPDATDSDNNRLLLDRLRARPDAPRTARFRCVLAISHAGTLRATFDGTIEGTIISELRGGGGFGYDPLFIPEGHTQTFGQLPATVKNTISHRSRALAAFQTWLLANPI